MRDINKKIYEIALKRCSTPEKIEDYLFPEKTELKNPFELKGVKEATKRIIEGIENNEKILIYGDYDADGITSTALLFRAISKVYDEIYYYIPERDGEGYGLNHDALDKIYNDEIKLLITVDCGIKSNELISNFSKKGLDFIITDHHTPDDVIPEGIIVNPKLSKEEDFIDLAGVGVAYTIATALGQHFQEIKNINSDFLQLAAIGTVADLVNLNIENRKIVRKGIIELNKNPLVGIQSLIEKNKLSEINSKSIAFFLAPVINSSGRMESPETALKLLLSDDKKETDILAENLVDLNNQRKKLVENVYKEVQKEILENHYFADPFIIVEKENWPHGILGIVASKLMNEYKRPILILSKSEDGLYKGSARSIENYNLFNALKRFENILEEFGGHSQAAGLSIRKNKISILRKKLNIDIYNELESEDFYHEFSPELEIKEIAELDRDLYKDLALLEPFGTGNPEPLFNFANPANLKLRKIGKLKDHLKIDVSDPSGKINGIYFNYQEYPGNEAKSDLIFALGINEWQNKVTLQLEIKKIVNSYRINSQKMEQKIYSNLLFSLVNKEKNFTTTEKIKYNEIWNVLKNSKTVLYSKEEKLNDISPLCYFNDKDFPENFKNIKRFLENNDNNNILLTDSLLLKEEILVKADNYIFVDRIPSNNMIAFLKNSNPQINIFTLENSILEKKMSRDLLSSLYLMIKKIYANPCSLHVSEFQKILKDTNNFKITEEEIITGIMIFEELGFLEYSLKNSLLEIKINQKPNKTNLEKSRLYNILNSE